MARLTKLAVKRSRPSVTSRSAQTRYEIVRFPSPSGVLRYNVNDVDSSAANDFWGKTFKNLAGEAEMTRQLSIITGCSAGATESFVVVPFELVKIKCVPPFLLLCLHAFSQTDHCRLQDKALASTYSGPLDVVRQIVRKDGILGLYAGMEATFWRYVDLSCLPRDSGDTARCYHRHLWWNGGYFGSIFQVKTMLPKAEVCCLPFLGYPGKEN